MLQKTLRRCAVPLLLVVILFIPFVFSLLLSLASGRPFFATIPLFLERLELFTFQNFASVFLSEGFAKILFNSFSLTFVSLLITIAVSCAIIYLLRKIKSAKTVLTIGIAGSLVLFIPYTPIYVIVGELFTYQGLVKFGFLFYVILESLQLTALCVLCYTFLSYMVKKEAGFWTWAIVSIAPVALYQIATILSTNLDLLSFVVLQSDPSGLATLDYMSVINYMNIHNEAVSAAYGVIKMLLQIPFVVLAIVAMGKVLKLAKNAFAGYEPADVRPAGKKERLLPAIYLGAFVVLFLGAILLNIGNKDLRTAYANTAVQAILSLLLYVFIFYMTRGDAPIGRVRLILILSLLAKNVIGIVATTMIFNLLFNPLGVVLFSGIDLFIIFAMQYMAKITKAESGVENRLLFAFGGILMAWQLSNTVNDRTITQLFSRIKSLVSYKSLQVRGSGSATQNFVVFLLSIGLLYGVIAISYALYAAHKKTAEQNKIEE